MTPALDPEEFSRPFDPRPSGGPTATAMDERSPPPSPPGVDLSQRLPPEVNYGHILTIVHGVRVDAATALMLGSTVDSGLAAMLRTGTSGQILAAIDAEIDQVTSLRLVSDRIKQEALRFLTYWKHSVYVAVLGEPALAQQGRAFRFTVVPTGFDAAGPLYLWPDQRIQVWSLPGGTGGPPVLLDERLVGTREEYTANWVRAVQELLAQHCQIEPLLRRRYLATARSFRHRPGWPVVTQTLIPRLYDYLRPSYPTRRYTKGRHAAGPAAYPRRLMEDMAELLRLERPDLCDGLTWRHVQAAVQRYLRHADPHRPLGVAMFRG